MHFGIPQASDNCAKMSAGFLLLGKTKPLPAFYIFRGFGTAFAIQLSQPIFSCPSVSLPGPNKSLKKHRRTVITREELPTLRRATHGSR